MKKIFCSFLVLLSLLTILPTAKADTTSTNTSFSLSAKAAIAVDSDSGKILWEQNSKKSGLGIASITKLITTYLTYQAVKDGKLKWDTKVSISDYAYNLTLNSDASNVTLKKGESFTVKDLVNAMLLPSANSAAIALAEKIAGSEPKFVDQMTALLKKWGITDAKLVNASGLNNADLPAANRYPGSGATDENTMSAQDVATIAIHLLADYPAVLNITKQSSLTFDAGGASEQTISNTNYMLPGHDTSRIDVDGLKTGSTTLAGGCFVGTSMSNFRIITVILGAATDDTDRFVQTDSLMTQVYNNWTLQPVSTRTLPIDGYSSVPVQDGTASSVKAVAAVDDYAVVPVKGANLATKFDKPSGGYVSAPVKKGDKLATAYFTLNDSLGYLPGYSGQKVNLVAQNDVPEANIFVVAWNHFVRFVNKNL